LAAAATQVRGGRPPIGRGRGGAPLKLEEGDHQLEGAGGGAEEDEEEEEEVLQGLLLCSMCTIEHNLGYVIISYVFVSPSMIWT
jgi:hypothetical protein